MFKFNNKDTKMTPLVSLNIFHRRMGQHSRARRANDRTSYTREKNKQLNWTNKMKIDVVIMDKEERAKGRGFLKRVKERWDQKYPED